jgi:hypothetical protein
MDDQEHLLNQKYAIALQRKFLQKKNETEIQFRCVRGDIPAAFYVYGS